MKIKGRELRKPNVEPIIIPRGDGDDIVLMAQAVLDYDEFNKLCPAPKPPEKLVKGRGKIKDVEDPGYKKEMDQWGKLKTNWTFIQSLNATEGLEWDIVKLEDMNTWNSFEEELKKSGFSEIEIQRIISGIMNANCLNEVRLEEARTRFLLSQEELSHDKLSSHPDEQKTTPSGAPANASA